MDLEKLEKLLEKAIADKVDDKKLNAIMMSHIAQGLADVCDGLTKIEEKRLIDFEAKLVVSKKGLSKSQVKAIEKGLDGHKKNKQSFERYAKIFAKFAELSENKGNG